MIDDWASFCLLIATLIIMYLDVENRYMRFRMSRVTEKVHRMSAHGQKVIDVAQNIANSLESSEKSLHTSRQIIEDLLSRAVPVMDDDSDEESLMEFRETMRIYYAEWRKLYPYGVLNEPGTTELPRPHGEKAL